MSFMEFISEAREELCYFGTLYLIGSLAVIFLENHFSVSKKKIQRKRQKNKGKH